MNEDAGVDQILIDVIGDGVTTLDTREVYILVPARYQPPG